MPKKPRDPFDVSLSEEKESDLVHWLSEEIESALTARDRLIGDGQAIERWRGLYKQGRNKGYRDKPWEGAADLTSYIGTEKVDTLRSNVVDGIFVEPVWAVEGQGESATRAPIVEEFHQWVLEKKERLQGRLQKAIHNSLIEKVGVLETYEATDSIKTQSKQWVKVLVNEQGLPVLNPKGEPQPARDQMGAFILADPQEAGMEVIQEDRRLIHMGPRHRVIAIRDFLVLPGHAADTDDIWGYAKRIRVRLPVLKSREKNGIYRNVDQLPEGEEVSLTAEQRAGGQELAAQRGRTVEKELWEVNFRHDLDEDGHEEWYKATLSKDHKVLLRCQRDDINLSPYSLFIPFPDPDSAWNGFSYIGDKLETVIDEHTSLRNMSADRGALKTNAPIKVRRGCPWEPDDQPWGPGQTIPVNDENDVTAMDIPDVPMSMVEQKRDVEKAAERLSGVPDQMSGVQSGSQRTLGENQMVMGGANMRAKEVLRNIQETLEELGQLRHVLWMRALAADPRGLQAPQSVVNALQEREVNLTGGAFTADMLRGEFHFKPRGSVESADPNRQKQDFNAFLMVLSGLAKSSPAYGAWLSHPKTIKALASYAIRLFKFPDRAAMLEALTEALMPPPMVPGMSRPQLSPNGVPVAPLMQRSLPAQSAPSVPTSNVQPGALPPPGPPPMPGGPGVVPPTLAAILQRLQGAPQ